MRVKAGFAMAIGLLPALLVAPARAHHAFAAEFDADKPVKFEGATVVKMEWVNPHAWIHVDVPVAGGKVERWAIEAGTPNVLFRRGFTKQSLAQGFVRAVPVNGSAHAPAHIRFWNGDARGRWEGDTLVVDITNFSHKTDFQGSRENLHLVERFRRVSDQRLEYTVTVEDGTTWTRPWTFMVPWQKQPDKANQVYESTCHEGNYGMVGMLANTRAAERLFKQGKGKDPRTMDIATGGDTGGGIERAGVE